MLPIDTSWSALLRTGLATAYFVRAYTPPFDANATAYSPINAWWLAELSRLIYRQGTDELGERASGPTRAAVLGAIGLHEAWFGDGGLVQWAIIGPSRGDPFSVLIFRGTNAPLDWLVNLNAWPVPWPDHGKVHKVFLAAIDNVWDRIADCLSSAPGRLIFSGHSLGGALATLAAARHTPPILLVRRELGIAPLPKAWPVSGSFA